MNSNNKINLTLEVQTNQAQSRLEQLKASLRELPKVAKTLSEISQIALPPIATGIAGIGRE